MFLSEIGSGFGEPTENTEEYPLGVTNNPMHCCLQRQHVQCEETKPNLLTTCSKKRKGFNTCDRNDSNECKTDVWFIIHTTCTSGESGNNHGYNMKRASFVNKGSIIRARNLETSKADQTTENVSTFATYLQLLATFQAAC